MLFRPCLCYLIFLDGFSLYLSHFVSSICLYCLVTLIPTVEGHTYFFNIHPSCLLVHHGVSIHRLRHWLLGLHFIMINMGTSLDDHIRYINVNNIVFRLNEINWWIWYGAPATYIIIHIQRHMSCWEIGRSNFLMDLKVGANIGRGMERGTNLKRGQESKEKLSKWLVKQRAKLALSKLSFFLLIGNVWLPYYKFSSF